MSPMRVDDPVRNHPLYRRALEQSVVVEKALPKSTPATQSSVDIDNTPAPPAPAPAATSLGLLDRALADVRGAFGPETVRKLLAELPAVVVKALEQKNGALNLQPGESALQAARRTFGVSHDNAAFMHNLARAMLKGADHLISTSNSTAASLSSYGKAFGDAVDGIALPELGPEPQYPEPKKGSWGRELIDDVAVARYRDDKKSWEGRKETIERRPHAIKAAERYNAAVLEACPTAPKDLLLALPGGGGGTMTIDELAELYTPKRYNSINTSLVAEKFPAIIQGEKDRLTLEAHVRSTSFASMNDVIALRASATDPSTPPSAVVQNLLRTLSSVAALSSSHGPKVDEHGTRTTITTTGTTRTQSDLSRWWNGDQPNAGSMAHHSSKSEIFAEASELVREARNFKIDLASDPGKLMQAANNDDRFPAKNLTDRSHLEMQVALAQVLQAVRLFECLDARDASLASPFRMFFDESVVSLPGKKEGTTFEIPLRALRETLLRTELLPASQKAVLEQELAMGPPQLPGNALLAGVRHVTD
jgi:hypothetical protein